MRRFWWIWNLGLVVSMTAHSANEVVLPNPLLPALPQVQLHPDLQLKQDLLKSHLALQAFINSTETNKANDLSQGLSELDHDLKNMIIQLNAGRKLPQ